MKRAPVDIEEPPFQTVTTTLSSLISTSRTASKYEVPYSAAVPRFVTKAPIEKGGKPFQHVSTIIFPNTKVPDSLSKLYVKRKLSLDTTD